MKRLSERGSALFFILICVALFAALAFSVAQMMRGGNPNIISDEKAKLAGDEILAYARSLRQAAQNVKISNGCTDANISFENNTIAGYEHTPAVSDNCKIFNPSGGGLVYQPAVPEWLDLISPTPALQGKWYFPANTCAPGTGTAQSDCSTDGVNNEALIAVLPYIKRAICLKINDALGVTNPGGNPPQETGSAWPTGSPKYTGSQSNGETLDQNGNMAGCFQGAFGATPEANTYHFYQILIPR